ncbi:hypothetical protein [Petrimonas sp.]|uniref:hypothetical protein n=1 Tax=Petrimonas sp. TaxID=2023866 RepID=UPI003F5122CE
MTEPSHYNPHASSPVRLSFATFFASFDAVTVVYSITETVRRYENLSMPLFVRNSQ